MISSAELPIRIHFLLNYAEYLLVDPSLWRIAVIYMYECGHAGKLRADEILLRIPLNLGNAKEKGKAVEAGLEIDADDDALVDGRVRQVLELCKEYGREAVRREICRVCRQLAKSDVLSSHRCNLQIAARTFTELGKYPLAISYYTSADDWPGVGRIVDLMLTKSITSGKSSGIVDAMSLTTCWL
jgi:nuclear pore complex protein Nup85